MNEHTAHTWAHVHTLQRVCTQMCMQMSKHLFNIHTGPAHAWCSRTPVWMHATLSTKMLMHPCICNGADIFCHGNYCELSWVLCKHHAGCRLPHALLLSPRNRSPDAARSRKPSKSKLAHGAVAATVSHKHHSIIRVGAGLVQFVYGSYSKLDHGEHPSQNWIFAILRAFFYQFINSCELGVFRFKCFLLLLLRLLVNKHS